MANPNPSPKTRFKPGHPGGPGAPKGRRVSTILAHMIGKKGIDQALAEMWLQRAMKGDYRYFRELLDRLEGKIASPDDDVSGAAPKPRMVIPDADPRMDKD